MPLIGSFGAGSSIGFGRGKGASLWGKRFVGTVSRDGSNDLVFTITSTVGATNLWLLNNAESSSVQVLNNASSASFYFDSRNSASDSLWNFMRANTKQVIKIGPSSSGAYKEKALWFDFEQGTTFSVNHGTEADQRTSRSTKTLRTLSSDGISSDKGIFIGIGGGAGGSGTTNRGGGGGSGKVSFKIVESAISSYQLFPGNTASNRKGWDGASDGYRTGGDTLLNVNGSTNVTAHGALVGNYGGSRTTTRPPLSAIAVGLEAYGGSGSESGQTGYVIATANDTSGTTRWYFHSGGAVSSAGQPGTGWGAGGGGQGRTSNSGGGDLGGGGAGGWSFGTTSVPSGTAGTYENVGSGGVGTVGAAMTLLILK